MLFETLVRIIILFFFSCFTWAIIKDSKKGAKLTETFFELIILVMATMIVIEVICLGARLINPKKKK